MDSPHLQSLESETEGVMGHRSKGGDQSILNRWWLVDLLQKSDNLFQEKLRIYMGVSENGGTQNGSFIRENPIKMDDLGEPLFQETTI